jgi:hypothetical protein
MRVCNAWICNYEVYITVVECQVVQFFHYTQLNLACLFQQLRKCTLDPDVYICATLFTTRTMAPSIPKLTLLPTPTPAQCRSPVLSSLSCPRSPLNLRNLRSRYPGHDLRVMLSWLRRHFWFRKLAILWNVARAQVGRRISRTEGAFSIDLLYLYNN